MDPATMNALINALIMIIMSIMKAAGITEEEAKAKLLALILKVEELPELPMDEG